MYLEAAGDSAFVLAGVGSIPARCSGRPRKITRTEGRQMRSTPANLLASSPRTTLPDLIEGTSSGECPGRRCQAAFFPTKQRQGVFRADLEPGIPQRS